MAFSGLVLYKREAVLGPVWIAGTSPRLLKKREWQDYELERGVRRIIDLVGRQRLRLSESGTLLLGVSNIYALQAKNLKRGVEETLSRIKLSSRPLAINLPIDQQQLSIDKITLQGPSKTWRSEKQANPTQLDIFDMEPMFWGDRQLSQLVDPVDAMTDQEFDDHFEKQMQRVFQPRLTISSAEAYDPLRPARRSPNILDGILPVPGDDVDVDPSLNAYDYNEQFGPPVDPPFPAFLPKRARAGSAPAQPFVRQREEGLHAYEDVPGEVPQFAVGQLNLGDEDGWPLPLNIGVPDDDAEIPIAEVNESLLSAPPVAATTSRTRALLLDVHKTLTGAQLTDNRNNVGNIIRAPFRINDIVARYDQLQPGKTTLSRSKKLKFFPAQDDYCNYLTQELESCFETGMEGQRDDPALVVTLPEDSNFDLWLRKNSALISSASEVESLARQYEQRHAVPNEEADWQDDAEYQPPPAGGGPMAYDENEQPAGGSGAHVEINIPSFAAVIPPAQLPRAASLPTGILPHTSSIVPDISIPAARAGLDLSGIPNSQLVPFQPPPRVRTPRRTTPLAQDVGMDIDEQVIPSGAPVAASPPPVEDVGNVIGGEIPTMPADVGTDAYVLNRIKTTMNREGKTTFKKAVVKDPNMTHAVIEQAVIAEGRKTVQKATAAENAAARAKAVSYKQRKLMAASFMSTLRLVKDKQIQVAQQQPDMHDSSTYFAPISITHRHQAAVHAAKKNRRKQHEELDAGSPMPPQPPSAVGASQESEVVDMET